MPHRCDDNTGQAIGLNMRLLHIILMKVFLYGMAIGSRDYAWHSFDLTSMVMATASMTRHYSSLTFLRFLAYHINLSHFHPNNTTMYEYLPLVGKAAWRVARLQVSCSSRNTVNNRPGQNTTKLRFSADLFGLARACCSSCSPSGLLPASRKGCIHCILVI